MQDSGFGGTSSVAQSTHLPAGNSLQVQIPMGVCDSRSSISNVAKHTGGSKSCRIQLSNVDLLSQVATSKLELGLPIHATRIEGHQSKQREGNKDVAHNNRVDEERATEYRERNLRRQSIERTDHIPETRVSIQSNGIRQVAQVEACIRFHINGYYRVHRYLQTHNEWSDDSNYLASFAGH